MISEDQALAIARESLAMWGPDIAIREDRTQSHSFGWVFFYNSRQFIETGDFNHMFVGNAPLIVTRLEGKTFFTGTAQETAYYVRNFKLTGDPEREPEWSILALSADQKRRIPIVRYLWMEMGLSLAHATAVACRLLDGEAAGILASNEESAREAGAALAGLGVTSEVVCG